jgi:hypothetical protein|tara:strand:+ start:861 stop:1280 length:420 start_codon:yes stop_codon:yes gene_type:complete
MDLDNIFELFSDSEFIKDDESPIDFSKTPIYWVGMYKKIVLNHINFNKKVLKFFKEANYEFDIVDIKEAGEFIVYNRAWHYIENIDLKNKKHILALSEYSDEYLDTSLKLGINFFEQQEQYERCAVLKEILDKTQEFIT